MPEEISEVIVEGANLEAQGKDFDELKAQLFERCKAAKITIEEKASEDDVEIYFEVSMPCGRESRLVYLFDTEDIQKFLSIPFEHISFLGDYSAVFFRDTQTIEAAIKPMAGANSRFMQLIERTVRDSDERRTIYTPVEISGICEGVNLKITIGHASLEFKVLDLIGGRGISLRIEGVPVMFHDGALQFLERFADSLFFQIDSLYSTPLALLVRRGGLRRVRRGKEEGANLAFPELEYDRAPMSLYFYGRGAKGLPLVQFLAFYQVLEFYYPICYQAEARRRVRGLLKDPSFRVDRDSDVTRVISALQSSSGFADERAMLRATIHECVDPHDLRRFLEQDEIAAEFYKKKAKGLTDRKLPLENKGADLRDDVADRIYELRCKIVHTKSIRDDGYELLLPHSREAGMLSYDIDLIHYIARHTLIFSSTPLKVGTTQQVTP